MGPAIAIKFIMYLYAIVLVLLLISVYFSQAIETILSFLLSIIITVCGVSVNSLFWLVHKEAFMYFLFLNCYLLSGLTQLTVLIQSTSAYYPEELHLGDFLDHYLLVYVPL
jgi:hypothetical protein